MTLEKPRLAETRAEGAAYIDRFIIPLLVKVGLKVTVKRNLRSYVLTVKLPRALPDS